MLDISDGFHEMGGVRWQLAACLLLAWILVGGCLIKGIKSQGKVSTQPQVRVILKHSRASCHVLMLIALVYLVKNFSQFCGICLFELKTIHIIQPCVDILN